MADRNYAVFIWYLLTTVLLEIAYTSAQDNPKEFVQLEKMQTNNSRSILIDGKTVRLDEWLPRVLRKRQADNDDDKKSKTMYAFIKCECAHYVNASMGYILNSLRVTQPANEVKKKKNCPQKPTKEENGQNAIQLLIKLNNELELAIAVLFETGDRHASVKSTEPYLLITLLQTSFYIRSLIYSHFIGKKLKYMNRVMLQITNLVHQFAIEHCNAGLDRDKNGQDELDKFNAGLGEFHKFLTAVVSPVPMSIDFRRITLGNRMMDDSYRSWYMKHGFDHRGSGSLTEFTVADIPVGDNMLRANVMVRKNKPSILSKLSYILQMARIRGPDGSDKRLRKIEYSYDVESIYNYMLVVYRILLKLIYQMTIRIWQIDQQLLDENWYKNTIAKLRSMNFPVEVIDNFVFAMKIEGYRSDGVETHKRAKEAAIHFIKTSAYTKIDEVILDNILINGLDDMWTLSNFMEGVVFDRELQQFWWVFNLMHRGSERKSRKAYDLSLDMYPKVNRELTVSDPITEFKCDSLEEIYRNVLNVEISITSYRLTTKQIRYKTYMLLCYLLRESEKLLKHDEWIDNDQLSNIFLATSIHLYREVYFELEDEYLIKKCDKLRRIIYVFTNLLNNYQIRNCRVINDPNFVYRSILDKIGNVQGVKKSGSRSAPLTVDDSKDVPEGIPEDIHLRIYAFNDLIQSNSAIDVKIYGTVDFFLWNGEMKNIRDIQTDVLENVLNIHDLVHYQRLYSKWLNWLFYKTRFSRLTFDDLETLKSNGLPTLFSKFVEYCESKLNFYKTVHNYGDHEERSAGVFDVVKKETMSSMTVLFGIIKQQSDDEKMLEQNELFQSLDPISKNINEHFIFLE